jgi:hypothetical protein
MDNIEIKDIELIYVTCCLNSYLRLSEKRMRRCVSVIIDAVCFLEPSMNKVDGGANHERSRDVIDIKAVSIQKALDVDVESVLTASRIILYNLLIDIDVG